MSYENQRLMYPSFRLSNCVGICNQTTTTASREKFSFSIQQSSKLQQKHMDKHTKYKQHIQDLQGSSSPDYLPLEDGTHWLPPNVSNYQSTLHNIPEEWRFRHCGGSLKSHNTLFNCNYHLIQTVWVYHDDTLSHAVHKDWNHYKT